MKYEEAIEHVRKLNNKPFPEKKKEFKKLIPMAKPYSQAEVMLTYEYAYCFYSTGNFKKMEELLNPILTNYRKYKFCKEIIFAFLMMGVVKQAFLDYDAARFYYEMALSISKRHKCVDRYFMCNNNLSVLYTSLKDYDKALFYLEEAEEYASNEQEYAYIYLNKCNTYLQLKKYDLALEAYHTSIDKYHIDKYNVAGLATCNAVEIYHALGQKDRVDELLEEALEACAKLPMHNVIETYDAIMNHAFDTEDYALIERVIALFDGFIQEHPEEYHLGLKIYSYKYRYAKVTRILDEIVAMADKRDYYASKIIEENEKKAVLDSTKAIENGYLKHANEVAKKKNKQLAKLSVTDSLTGIENRHAYNMHVQGKTKLVSPNVTYSIMDIDDFKHINDNYSHLEGDKVLVAVGAVLQKYVAPNVYCYRYGGDEFVVVVTDIPYEDAIKVLIEIRKKISKIKYANGKYNISCTMGVSSTLEFNEVGPLVEAADRRLYIGKNHKGEMITEG